MHSNIRFELGLSRHGIQHIHPVQHRPLDLQMANTLVVIVQKPDDIARGDLKKLVSIDVVFHEQRAGDTTTHRYATSIRSEITRSILLEELRLQAFCMKARNKCLVNINGNALSRQMHAPTTLHHGDYIRIDLQSLELTCLPELLPDA